MNTIKLSLVALTILASASSAFAVTSGRGDRETTVGQPNVGVSDTYVAGSSNSAPAIDSQARANSMILENSRADIDSHNAN